MARVKVRSEARSRVQSVISVRVCRQMMVSDWIPFFPMSINVA